MSIGFKPCPHCDNGEAEALYAVDGMIEWYCHVCGINWAESPATSEVVGEAPLYGYNSLGEEV